MLLKTIETAVHALLVVSCVGVLTTPAAAQHTPDPPLHYYEPAPADERVWVMPPLPHRDPAYPRLSGEDEEAHSVGNVSDGWLANAVAVDRPHPHMAILQVQRQRGLHYTTPEMLEIIEAAAAHVQKSHPDSPVWLGNFSAAGGGDIPYSVSHNSGRDADVGFFLVDSTNTPVQPRDLLPLDSKGRFVKADGTTYYFDVPRNWAFVEGLIRAAKDDVQYIFISRPLRRLLIRYARDQNVDNSIVAAAARRLIQPSGALPHNDHFHIRIYCHPDDLGAGCVELGSPPRGYSNARAEALANTTRKIREDLASDDPRRRVAAVRRMAEVGIWDGLSDAIVDPDPMVRAAAVRLANRGGATRDEIADRLRADRDGRVFVEVVRTLSEFGDDPAWDTLVTALEAPRPVNLAARQISDGRVVVAQTLGASERLSPVGALIDRLDESEELDRAIRGALRHLTNASAPADSNVVEWWRAWWAANGDRSRDELVAQGFRDAGYAVESVETGSVWGMVRAVRDERPWIAWNAQRALQRMTTSDAPTLTWPQYDAWYYWRWWFQKKTRLSEFRTCPTTSTPNGTPTSRRKTVSRKSKPAARNHRETRRAADNARALHPSGIGIESLIDHLPQSKSAMHRTRTGPVGRLIVVFFFLFVPALSGCGENLEPTNPEGAYNTFRQALFTGDGEAVWARLAPSSHEYFDEQYNRLVEMDEKIEKYLPATDHKLAREQAGSILTDQVEGGKGLFLKVFDGASMPKDPAYEVGMDIEEVTVTEDEQSAKLLTRGGQTYILTRVEGSEEWFVMLVRSKEMSNAVSKSLTWLESNETALDKTIEDLIEEEKTKREALIAKLMDIEKAEESKESGD